MFAGYDDNKNSTDVRGCQEASTLGNSDRGYQGAYRDRGTPEAESPSFLPVPEADALSRGGRGAKPPAKRSKIARVARRWSWLKQTGGYIYYMPYYFSSQEDYITSDQDCLGWPVQKSKLELCQHIWVRERKGEDKIRYRGYGCGERDYCPLCGMYRQLVLAQEAAEAMLLAQTGAEIAGVKLSSYGLKLVLTIPKSESARIDSLLFTDPTSWKVEVNRLYKAYYAFANRWFGAGIGGVVSMDYTGEGAPADAHYHGNVYVAPFRLSGRGFVPVGHWIDKSRLAEMRADWTGVVNKMFGLKLEDANLKCQYLGSQGQLYHWMRYLYRNPLADLWQGWQGVDDGNLRDPVFVNYKVGKGKEAKTIKLSDSDMQRIADRQEAIPAHFKRIRWFGIFSDGQRAKTMASLGLELVETNDDDDDDGDGEKWERDGSVFSFSRFTSKGVILREHLRDENGSFFDDEDGHKLGPEFLVPDKLIDYRPSNVGIGKRKRWREPGY